MPPLSDPVLIFCMLLPGAALLILGIYNAVKIYRLKEIASFRLMEDSKILHFSKPGTYCLIVAGGNKVKQLPLRIVSQVTGKGVDAYSVVPAPRSFKKGSIAVTYCRFVIEDAGQYEIIIKDYDKVVVWFRFPGPVGLLANRTISPQSLKLIVEEHASGFTHATAIIGTLTGILILMFSSIFLLQNHGKIKHLNLKLQQLPPLLFRSLFISIINYHENHPHTNPPHHRHHHLKLPKR